MRACTCTYANKHAHTCIHRVPRQRMIPFHKIRSMQPEEFVQLLVHDLRAAGVVAGCNYRFGAWQSRDGECLHVDCKPRF